MAITKEEKQRRQTAKRAKHRRKWMRIAKINLPGYVAYVPPKRVLLLKEDEFLARLAEGFDVRP